MAISRQPEFASLLAAIDAVMTPGVPSAADLADYVFEMPSALKRLVLVCVLGAGFMLLALAMLRPGDSATFPPKEAAALPTATLLAPSPSPTPRPPRRRDAATPRLEFTPDPTRADSEVTLIDVATGKTVALWEPRFVTWGANFSTNGIWLSFSRQSSVTNYNEAYIVRLTDPSLSPQRVSDGIANEISPDGSNLLITRGTSVEGSHLFVHHPDGSEVALGAGYGYMAAWSPDGRWLAYNGIDPQSMRYGKMLYDSATGNQRFVGRLMPCQCDGTSGAEWSADSQYFEYGFAEGGSAVASVNDGSLIVGATLFAIASTPARPTPSVQKGTTKAPQGSQLASGIELRRSPDGEKIAFVRIQALGPNPNATAPDYATSTDVFVLNTVTGVETRLLHDARGNLGCLTWSSDSRFLVLNRCGV